MNDIQAETLEAINRCMGKHGEATVRQIGAELGLTSPSSAHLRVRNLEAAGLIERVGARKLIVVKEKV